MRPLALLPLLACTGGDPVANGAAEALQVRDATFFLGDLPENPDTNHPTISYAGTVSSVVTQGQGNVPYKGVASAETYAIALTFPTLSEGYWVLPTQGADVTQEGAQLFSAILDFTPELPYGLQSISVVALDEDDRAGPRYDSTLCILPESADGNLAVCTPEVVPQTAVLSLSWDAPVDLDLFVLTPAGKLVTSKSPTTAAAEGEVPDEMMDDPTTGFLSRDSNKNCAIDNINLESLVFAGDPPPGDYEVYASLYSDCGQSTVNFGLSLFTRLEAQVDEAGGWPVERSDIALGLLQSQVADGGQTRGTHIATVTLP